MHVPKCAFGRETLSRKHCAKNAEVTVCNFCVQIKGSALFIGVYHGELQKDGHAKGFVQIIVLGLLFAKKSSPLRLLGLALVSCV